MTVKKLVTLATAILVANTCVAQSDSESVQFILNQVAKRNFTGCDSAIRNVFKFAAGDDVRVFTDLLAQTKTDSLRVTVIYGKPGDAVYDSAVLRKVGKACISEEITVMSQSKSCTSFLAENPVWKLEADTVGVLSAKNSGGVNMELIPQGKTCVQVTRMTRVW